MRQRHLIKWQAVAFFAVTVLLLPIVLSADIASGGQALEQEPVSIDLALAANAAGSEMFDSKTFISQVVSVPATVELPAKAVALQGDVYLLHGAEKELLSEEGAVVQAGVTLETGPDGLAELFWPDGSSILISHDTELRIEQALGSISGSYLENGLQALEMETRIEYVRLVLTKGTIYGFLVPTDEVDEESDKSGFEEPVRVEVDMPWGVAGIRGTVWMNSLELNREITSVLTGSVQVTSAGVTVAVEPGQSVHISSKETPPGKPFMMQPDDLNAWQNAGEWVEKVISFEKNVQHDLIKSLNLSNGANNDNDSNEGKPDSPGQGGSAPGHTGDTPGLSGNTPGQNGSEPPGLSGNTPGLSGDTPGLSGSAPGQTGNTPGLSGNTPGQGGSEPPGLSGNTPGLSGGAPGNSGDAPGNSGGAPGNSGNAPGQNR